MEVRIIGDDSVALYLHRQYTLDERTEGALVLPQRSKSWGFESPASQSEFDDTFWADRVKLGGDPYCQFLEFEDTGCCFCVDDTMPFIPSGRSGLLLFLFLLFLLLGRGWLTFFIPNTSSVA